VKFKKNKNKIRKKVSAMIRKLINKKIQKKKNKTQKMRAYDQNLENFNYSAKIKKKLNQKHLQK